MTAKACANHSIQEDIDVYSGLPDVSEYEINIKIDKMS